MKIIKNYLKNIFVFLGVLIPWLLSGLIFNIDNSFYNSLDLPSFTLSGKIISIIWFIIYITITISIILVSKRTNILKNNDYIYILIINYLSNQLFLYFFFYLMSPFLGFAITVINFLSTIFLYLETKKISKKASNFLIPYIIYGTYALILMTTVYFMNF